MLNEGAPQGPADTQDLALREGVPGPPWEVLRDVLLMVAALGAALGYVGSVVLVVANHLHPQWHLYAAPALLMIGSLVVFALDIPYRGRALFMVAIMLSSCVLADWVSPWVEPPFLYSLVCIVAGILLGSTGAISIAALGTVAVVGHSQLLPGDLFLFPSLATLWLTALIVGVSSGKLYLAVRRAQASENRAWQRAREADLRRGELARARKALSDMYALLERTNHELAVARREADEARHIKAQFAANISHELRTPLNLILGFSEMMYRSPEAYRGARWTPALRADIREIYRASQHLLGMIDDILDLSRVEAQRLPLMLEATDMGDLIREAVDTAAGLLREKPVSLSCKVPGELPQVLVDRARIRQVLLNLLKNAIRFTDEGSIVVSAATAKGELVVSVSDTGVGIPADEMATVFEEFGQARAGITGSRGGTGLGLAICKQFVRLHGGHIEANSKVGQGSTFRFMLPLPRSGCVRSWLSYYAPEGWSPPVPENPLGKVAIVIDSNPQRAAVLGRTVPGYRVVTVASLDELAEVVQAEHPAGIVVIDDSPSRELYPPNDVWQAAGRSDLPLVRLELAQDKAVRRELGVAAYLTKPIEREQLVAALRRVCTSPRSVLVVDDDVGFVSLLDRMLKVEFPLVSVRKAYSGAEAVALLKENTYDVVLLDLIMTETSGFDVIRAIADDKSAAGTAVVVVSGSGYEERVQGRQPLRLHLLREEGVDKTTAGSYLRALLDTAPPDYSSPAPPAAPPASAVATLAS